MFNFLLKIYKMVLKILIIIFGGAGIYLSIYYPLFALLGKENTAFPDILATLGITIYFIGVLVNIMEDKL